MGPCGPEIKHRQDAACFASLEPRPAGLPCPSLAYKLSISEPPIPVTDLKVEIKGFFSLPSCYLGLLGLRSWSLHFGVPGWVPHPPCSQFSRSLRLLHLVAFTCVKTNSLHNFISIGCHSCKKADL